MISLNALKKWKQKEELDKQHYFNQESYANRQPFFCRNRVKYCGQKKNIKVKALRLITVALNYLGDITLKRAHYLFKYNSLKKKEKYFLLHL